MTDTASKELFEFKKNIRNLREYAGRGTELISLYITPEYPISDIAGKLRDEYGQASNIKSKSTQKNVQAALEKILAFLKTFKKPPENGIAIFSGNVSQNEGKVDVQLFFVTPPFPLATQFYRCESKFVLHPLEEMLEHTGTYGLVVLDGKDATIATLQGKKLKVLRHLHSTAQQKVHKGGQCIYADELVEFADGKIAPISTVQKGDLLMAVDLATKMSKPSQVTEVFTRTSKNAISLTVKNPIRKINVTPEHRFFVITENGIVEKTALELKEGEMLLFVKDVANFNVVLNESKTTERQNLMQIIKHKAVAVELAKKEKIVPSKDDVYYDLTLPETSNFIVNGFCVHNSAARFQRIHEETTEKYYQRIGEAMDVFLEIKNLEGVIVGGPGPSKEYFLDLKAYNYQLKILGVVDTGYADEYGLQELMEKAKDILKEQEAIKEKALFGKFVTEVSKNGLAVYGLEKTREALDAKRVETLLLTEDMELFDCEFICGSCGKKVSKVMDKKEQSVPCECGQHMKVGLCHLRIEDLLEEAEAQAIPVEYISVETDEGRQFYGAFKGIGALLRY